MPDPAQEFEARVAALEQGLRRIEARLERLERPRDGAPADGASPLPASGVADATVALSGGTLGLVGRTLVALGGGFLIRALTDAGTLPPLGGIALGLAYAGSWLMLADRAAAAGQRTSAAFHGLTSGLIAYPLLWETTARFGLFPPPAALAMLVAVFGAGIAVARRRQLAFLAWVSTSLALGTTASLFVSTLHLLPVLSALLGIAVVVEWLAARDLWLGLRWAAALVLDVALLITVLLVSRPAGLPEGYPPASAALAVATALAVPAIYLSAIVTRTLRRGCPVTPFELFQGTAALVLGFGGAWKLLASQGAPATVLGVSSLVLGALCYAAAFAFVERHEGHNRNFYFYSTAGGVLTLIGSRAILEPTPLSLVWCLFAVASAGLGRRFGRMTLRFHGALYAWAAVVGAGLASDSWRDFFARAPAEWRLPTVAGGVTILAVLVVYFLLTTNGSREARWSERLPQAITAAAGAWILGGVLVAGFAMAAGPLLPAAVATLRTGVLALSVLGLGAAARQWTRPELAWFVYPLLTIGALKLVAEDLPQGRPLTLFLSLVLYGGALIAAPRLLRRPP